VTGSAALVDEVLCVGAGRGGHGLLPRIAARGESRLAILDDDTIEEPNLPALRLDQEWIGWSKAEHLGRVLAGTHQAVVRIGNVKFIPELLAAGSPFADFFFGQKLILAVTDSLAAQLGLAVTAAKLATPVIAVRVIADGGGDVFAQLDVERFGCLACFTAHLRRSGGPEEPLRGRDLPVGAGDAVDAFASDVAVALLGHSPELRRRLFSPHRRLGVPTAWEVREGLDDGAAPIFFTRDPACPICGSGPRQPRGASPSRTRPRASRSSRSGINSREA
jgi:hypothetical protein